MKIKVNGEEKYLSTSNKKISLKDTINLLGYKPNTIVVELNNLIINFESWENKAVEEGDKLEIVSIVGGGQCFKIKFLLKPVNISIWKI